MNSHIAQLSQRTVLARKLLLSAAGLCLTTCGAWSQTTATVTVNADSVSATVPPEGYGLNTDVYDGNMISSGVASQLKASGINSLRYPGGSYSDNFNFISCTDQGMNNGAGWESSDTFLNFMNDLAIPSGSKPVITLNYGSNTSDNGGASPSEAATWVQCANVTNNYGIVYWEIGNETYGNGYYPGWDWETDLHDTDTNASVRVGNSALSPTAYGTNAAAFVKATKAVDPNIKLGLSVRTDASGWDQGVFQGISSALSGSKYYPDFVIVHWYPSLPDSQVLATQADIPATVAQIRSELSSYYTLSNKDAIEILVTETGPVSEGGDYEFLFTVDDYLTWFENGASTIDFEDLHQGYLASPGDSGNPSGSYLDPYGPWYGVSLSSTVARPGDNMVAVTSSNSLLRAHAVNRTDGQTGVVLINDDPNNSTNVSVSVSGATLSGSGTQYKFGNANYSSGSWIANSGISESSIDSVGNNFTVNVPAYSAMGILIPTSSSCTPTVIVPAMNVGGVWTAESSATVASTSAVVDLGPQPLTGGSWSWTGPNGFTSTSREIDNIPLLQGCNVYTATYTNSCGEKSTQGFTICTPGGSFTLAASASSLSVAQGASATDTITVTDAGGFTGSVTLAASGLPSGVTAAFATNPTTSTSVVTFKASSSATAGTWTVTITGTSGSQSATKTIALTVSTSNSTLIANGTYIITAVNSGSAIDDPDSSKTDGLDMQIYAVNDGTNQQWTVNNLSTNVVTLTNVASGQLLDVTGASKSAEALVVQEPANGKTDQEWSVISVAGGAFELTNVNSGLALDVVGGGTTNGTGIDQYTYGGSAWQQWKFTPN